MKKIWPVLALGIAASFGVERAEAVPPTMCFAPGNGVPFSSGPPRWRDLDAPTVSTIPIDANFDDPRWRGAVALAYQTASGSANPPVQFRAVWGNDPDGMTQFGTTRFVYLQWVVRLSVWGPSSPSSGATL